MASPIRTEVFGSGMARPLARASDHPNDYHHQYQYQYQYQHRLKHSAGAQGQVQGPLLPCYGVYEVNRDYDYYDHSYDIYQYDEHEHGTAASFLGKTVESMTFTSSPERIRRSAGASGSRSISSGSVGLDAVPEERIMVDFPTITNDTSRDRLVIEVDVDEQDDEEQEEWELDETLSLHGLYRGSYHRILLLYTLTPLTSLLTFTLLAILPYFAYPLYNDPSQPWWPRPALLYFPHPLPDLVVSAALFSLSYILRTPIGLFFEKCCPNPTFGPNSKLKSKLKSGSRPFSLPLPLVLSTLTQTVITLALLLFPFIAEPPMLRLSHAPLEQNTEAKYMLTTRDPVFRRAWWMALGWGAAAAMAAVWKGYEARMLYRDVLVEVKRNKTRTNNMREMSPERQPLLPRSRPLDQQHEDGDMEEQVEEELEELLAIRAREELEEAFGVPVIKIPVFLSCLRQINALLLTQGLVLLLAHAYLRSMLSVAVPYSTAPSPPTLTRSNLPLALTLPACIVVHFYLSILYTPVVLPRMGVPVVVYHASLVSLGVFFAGLAVWEGLV